MELTATGEAVLAIAEATEGFGAPLWTLGRAVALATGIVAGQYLAIRAVESRCRATDARRTA